MRKVYTSEIIRALRQAELIVVEETTPQTDKTPEAKRLFRDTENGMLAGVAGAY